MDMIEEIQYKFIMCNYLAKVRGVLTKPRERELNKIKPKGGVSWRRHCRKELRRGGIKSIREWKKFIRIDSMFLDFLATFDFYDAYEDLFEKYDPIFNH